MANKRIDELTAATPVVGDFVATTGVGGPATKATVQQVYDANLPAVSVAYTGTAPPKLYLQITPKTAVQIGSTLIVPDGVTVETFRYIGGLSTTLTLPNLACVQGFIVMNNWGNLTSLSFPVLASTGNDFNPNTMALLATLSVPALAYVGNTFSPNTMALLATLSVPALAYVYNVFSPNTMAALTTLLAPALEYVGTNYSPSAMASLTLLTSPALAFVGFDFSPNTMASLTEISLPLLTSVGVNLTRTSFTSGRIAPATMGALTSLTFPVIEVIGSTSSISVNIVSGTAALSTFTLGSTLRLVNGNVIMTSCALLVASVDGLLVRLAALDGTGLTTAYSTKTVTITGTSATRSATGLAAKATLVARGCTVTHN